MCGCSVTQSCPSLCDPMDCSPPGSFVHGVLQARVLEWVAMPSSGGCSLPRAQTHVSCISCIGRWVLYHWTIWDSGWGQKYCSQIICHNFWMLHVHFRLAMVDVSSHSCPYPLFVLFSFSVWKAFRLYFLPSVLKFMIVWSFMCGLSSSTELGSKEEWSIWQMVFFSSGKIS